MNGRIGNKTLIIELLPNALYYYSLLLGVGHLKHHLLDSYENFRRNTQKDVEDVLLALAREVIQSMRLLIYQLRAD